MPLMFRVGNVMNNKKPNIIYIYADDLGRGMLSCYPSKCGDKHFETPNIDRLAHEGVRFENYYGCSYCAPARASLLTGRHDCHAGVWTVTKGGIYQHLSDGSMSYQNIREIINKTGIQAGPDEVFLAEVAQRAGYVTGEIGKLEWGFATTPERMHRHGWDYHYGYYDHQRCHGFYPPFLFCNGEKVDIAGNERADCGVHPLHDSPQNAQIRHDRVGKAVYSQDLFDHEILSFIRKHKDKPFFLWHPTQLPHGPTSIPEIHASLIDNPNLTDFEKEYASMVLRLDHTVGLILDELEDLGIAENTIVFFSSDNGHEIYYAQEGRTHCVGWDGGHDLAGNTIDQIDTKYYSDTCGDVFDGNDGMAGLKRCNLEGGVRLPALARWPKHIPAGSVCKRLVANYDFLPTLAELVGQPQPAGKDGQSFVSAILGHERLRDAPPYVVFASNQGPALVTTEGWKLRYVAMNHSFQLYYLPEDYREEKDVSGEYPELVASLKQQLIEECDGDLKYGHSQIQQIPYPCH
jgi:arylsulfatase A-like enzyme